MRKDVRLKADINKKPLSLRVRCDKGDIKLYSIKKSLSKNVVGSQLFYYY